MSYTDLTLKTIYGRSYNECNHPDCTQLIIEVDPNTGRVVNHGQMAHIRAQKPGGERWDPNYPKEQLNLPDNLILLCSNHHNVIDQKNAGEHYTVEVLEQWKKQHYLAKEIAEDREWVYGASSVSFWVDNEQHTLEYWRDQQGRIRFFKPEQLTQMQAARDLSLLFSQLGSLLSRIDQADPTPVNPSHQTQNDAMMRILKKDAERLKKSLFLSPGTVHQSALVRLYANLRACPDITLAELDLVGSEEKQRTTTLLVGGELTAERLIDAMKKPLEKERK